MSRQFKSFLLKILLLTSIIVGVFNIWDNFIIAKDSPEEVEAKVSNQSSFKKVNSSEIWKTWVAISTNIWIQFKQRSEIPATIYQDIFSINELMEDSASIDNIIASNMQITNEYKNVLTTNIKSILKNSLDKSQILDAIIDQLEFRYEKATEQINLLNSQKVVFEAEMSESEEKINIVKSKIETDFQNDNAEESVKNIDNYLKYKNDYYYARTYVIYINHFLYEYTALNSYNQKLLDTLINNREALLKDSYVVIPDSWIELLKTFDLLYTESEYKNK